MGQAGKELPRGKPRGIEEKDAVEQERNRSKPPSMDPRGNPVRVLIAKPGLDGHWRGALTLTMGLREEGFEVIYTGLRQTPEMIARAALQESVDVVGLSCLSGSHNYLFPRVVELLKEQGLDNVLVLGGGVIPESDIPYLKSKGISACFGPGSSIGAVAAYIREHVRR